MRGTTKVRERGGGGGGGGDVEERRGGGGRGCLGEELGKEKLAKAKGKQLEWCGFQRVATQSSSLCECGFGECWDMGRGRERGCEGGGIDGWKRTERKGERGTEAGKI